MAFKDIKSTALRCSSTGDVTVSVLSKLKLFSFVKNLGRECRDV